MSRDCQDGDKRLLRCCVALVYTTAWSWLQLCVAGFTISSAACWYLGTCTAVTYALIMIAVRPHRHVGMSV